MHSSAAKAQLTAPPGASAAWGSVKGGFPALGVVEGFVLVFKQVGHQHERLSHGSEWEWRRSIVNVKQIEAVKSLSRLF